MAEPKTKEPAGALSVTLQARLERFELSLEFEEQAPVICLFGPSGSGKSSCLEMIAGTRLPDSGRIQLGGQVLFDSQARINLPPADRRIGWVPQEGLLFPHLDVRGNLLFGHRPGPVTLDRTAEFLELTCLLDRRVRHLSGGEARRVALGRALLTNPRLILADEPFSGLDLPLRRRLMPLFRRVADELGIQLLLVSHLPGEVRALADRVVLLSDGRVTRTTTPQELTGAGPDPVNLLFGRLAEPGQVNLEGGALLQLPTGERPPGSWLRIELPASAVALSTEGASHSSIRNALSGRVVALAEQADQVLVTLDVGVRLHALVTPGAVGELGLIPGSEVHVLFKATALRIL